MAALGAYTCPTLQHKYFTLMQTGLDASRAEELLPEINGRATENFEDLAWELMDRTTRGTHLQVSPPYRSWGYHKMVPIPQNTLLGLPDELIVRIVRQATKSKYLVPTSSLARSKISKHPNRQGKLMAPLRANAQLWNIARDQFYNTNTFSITPGKMQNRGDEAGLAVIGFPMQSARTEYGKIKHLQVNLPFVLAADWRAEGLKAQWGAELPHILHSIAGRCPILHSLTVMMQHNASEGKSIVDALEGVNREIEPCEAYASEVSSCVVHTLKGLRTFTSASLKSKYFKLTQVPHAVRAKSVEIDGRRMELAEIAVISWDLPKSEIQCF
ncbi:hypothetical protein LTR36_004465 [Oleoguttula mirabilis]|uniref:F-box domain-containing protein n=1 Tax=Oleoguttula mirabilis TaxID=1507867 RepID=A0AAV9JGG8_9PEZI|nr:hypothetical protein LTR36_004465 [Oleoguttula mirabilis]